MPTALFVSINLMGDALNVAPALNTWMDEHPDWDVDLLTIDDYISVLYQGMVSRPIRIIPYSEPRSRYDFEHTFDVNAAFTLGSIENLHIAEAYAKLLNVKVPLEKYKLTFSYDESRIFGCNQTISNRIKKGLILFSPFSKSCSSNKGGLPNKMIPFEKWVPIVHFLGSKYPLAVLGAADDKRIKEWGL